MEKDGSKYCSPECYERHCGELCNYCANSVLEFYRDEKNPNTICCADCKKKREDKKFDFDGKKHVKDIVEAMKNSAKERSKKEEQHNKRERERVNSPQINCPNCNKSLTNQGTWYDEAKNDNKEFCSEKCCEEYYKISTEQQQNNSNLPLYILCGIIGVGLISLIAFLVIKEKKQK